MQVKAPDVEKRREDLKLKNQNRNPNPNTREETWKKREGQEKKEGGFYPKIYTLYITYNTENYLK